MDIAALTGGLLEERRDAEGPSELCGDICNGLRLQPVAEGWCLSIIHIFRRAFESFIAKILKLGIQGNIKFTETVHKRDESGCSATTRLL